MTVPLYHVDNSICLKCGNWMKSLEGVSKDFPYKCLNCTSRKEKEEYTCKYKELVADWLVDIWVRDDAPDWIKQRVRDELCEVMFDREISSGDVVRCEDCRFYDEGENEDDSWTYCTLHRMNTSREEFCSWGARHGD